LLVVLSDLLWGVQPFGLSSLIHVFDANTLAFLKMFSAGIFLLPVLAARRQFVDYRARGRGPLKLLVLAAVSLTVSYLTYALEFKFLTPDNTQLYLQTSRIFLALIGVFVFREIFRARQWAGLMIVCIGYVFFYFDQSKIVSTMNVYSIGVAIAMVASLTWAIFAAAQKRLMSDFTADQTLLFMYVLGSVLMLPFVNISPLAGLNTGQWFALLIVCVSNLAAFTCFSTALKYWQASRVSAVSCLTPLATIAISQVVSLFIELPVQEVLSAMAYGGIALVVAGSIMILWEPAKS